ncbi:MAG: helix-turn-helix domain-containing protein [Acidobacteriota bacterium]
MSQTFGERLREIRDSLKLTQRDIATRTGMDDYYISRLENNHINPTLSTINKIAQALQVEIRDLFPSPKPEFRIKPLKLEDDLKKVVGLWKSLIPEHRRLLLKFIEQTYKLDTKGARIKI